MINRGNSKNGWVDGRSQGIDVPLSGEVNPRNVPVEPIQEVWGTGSTDDGGGTLEVDKGNSYP